MEGKLRWLCMLERGGGQTEIKRKKYEAREDRTDIREDHSNKGLNALAGDRGRYSVKDDAPESQSNQICRRLDNQSHARYL